MRASRRFGPKHAANDRSGAAPPNAGARVSAAEAAIIGRATAAERQRLIALRADATIGDAAFQQIEQELDLEELYLQQLAPGGDPA